MSFLPSRAYIVIRAGVVHVATPEFTTETTEWFNHPTFVDQMAHVVQPNDIALLKLNEDVPYTSEFFIIIIELNILIAKLTY